MKFLYDGARQHRSVRAAGRAARAADRTSLIGPKNGRLARTIVNRLWARFMGRGLVEPVDDMEQAAWHPDLLDWLAEDLVAHGYDLKHTMTVILTSQAYQRVGGRRAPSGRRAYVFRGPAIRRLTAEQFVDAHQRRSPASGRRSSRRRVDVDAGAARTRAAVASRTRAALVDGRPADDSPSAVRIASRS